jgi:hypothetical protein
VNLEEEIAAQICRAISEISGELCAPNYSTTSSSKFVGQKKIP